jgi:hypothetical protein
MAYSQQTYWGWCSSGLFGKSITERSNMETKQVTELVALDIAGKIWYAHGRTPLGGCDYWQPIEETPDGIKGKTGNFGDIVVLPVNEYLEKRAYPLIKIGMWTFTSANDEAAAEKRYAISNPESAGRLIYDLKTQLVAVQAVKANLLEALQEVLQRWDCTTEQTPADQATYAKARAAIGKATK